MSQQIETKNVKTKEEIMEELKRLILEVKKELPIENNLREILMSKNENIRVYVEKWRDFTSIEIDNELIIKVYRGKLYIIDVNVDSERLITYSYLFECDEIQAYNKRNAKVATLDIKNMRIKAL
jgi:hypothetical protein